MSKVNCLSEIIGFDENYKNSINLYLNLNNRDKILRYIPTKSSISFFNDWTIRKR